ncbi:MAG TPA: hypothetical protein ENN21_09940 [Spirochaetes bacterium]|nr:hypothetical protein [Spirochaetota bacterium]
MKRRLPFFRLWALLPAVLVAASLAHAADIPPLKARVNDAAVMFSPAARSEVETLLAAHEKETTNQVVVVTVPSLEGEDLEGYSIRLAEAWKIGQKGKDNGVILLFSKNDRKVRIEVGYGLEGRLTDLICGRIIRYNIVPHFKAGRFDEGLRSGVKAVLGTIKGELTAAPPPAPAGDPLRELKYFAKKALAYIGAGLMILLGGGVALLLLVVFFNMAFFQKGSEGWLSFAILGPIFFLLSFFPAVSLLKFNQYFPIFRKLIGLGIIGLLVGAKFYFLRTRRGQALAKKYGMTFSGGGRSSSGSSSWSSSGSSYSSSGSSSGGFSGGGGSFGGGGASGGW